MDLKPDKKTVSEIFPLELNVTYNIPIYQRNYSWKDENIDTLVQDILKERQGYYLGNVIVTEYADKDNFFDIVDGQQRITTIALILLAIYDNLQEVINTELLNVSQVRPLHDTQNKIREKLLNTNNTPKLSLLSPDKEIYTDLLNSKLDISQNGRLHRNRLFGKRYDFTKNLIKSTFFEKNETLSIEKYMKGSSDLISFYQKLNYAEILRIRVPNLNDAYTIFTSFNAKGVPLTLIDLFKSFYLKEADGNISSNDAMNKWDELLSIFYNDNDEPISSVVTQFLLNNYDAFESKSKSSITQNSALTMYEKIFSEKGHNYIDDLINRAKIFSNLNGKIRTVDVLNLSKDTRKKLNSLYKLESTQIYPIVFYLLEKYQNKKITEDLINDLLDFLIVYFVRRNIILKPKASNIRAKVIQSVRDIDKSDVIELNNIKKVKENLLSIVASDEEFKVALGEAVYLISKNTTRFILISLERKYSTLFNKQRPDSLDEVQDNGNYIWTLEHIMPQSADTNSIWKQSLLEEIGDEEQIKPILDNNVHKFGNLTLTGYNSEMSARSFTEKKNYRDKSTNVETGLKTKLYLNESIVSKDEEIETKDKWTIEDINRRNKELIEKIVVLFSF